LNLGSGIIAPNDSTTDGVDIEADNGALDTEMAELSLGQRLRAMQRGEDGQFSHSDSDSDRQSTKKSKKGRELTEIEVPTESLSRTLTQALHSSDAKLLEGCLRHSDPSLIQNTVMRIPPQLAVPLLQACVERLARGRGGNTGRSRGSAASAQRGTVMIAWIKVVLVVHSGHLMTVCLSICLYTQLMLLLIDAKSCI
jgi:U3 small nucleolar RNA-associated protein 5